MAEIGSEIDPENLTEGDHLVIALAGGATVKAAAELAGMSERTAYRRRAEPDFRRRLAEVREQMKDRAIGHLSAAAADAVVTLRNVLNKQEHPALQVRAAEAILDRLGLDGGECTKCRRRADVKVSPDEEASNVAMAMQADAEAILSQLSVEQLEQFQHLSVAVHEIALSMAQPQQTASIQQFS